MIQRFSGFIAFIMVVACNSNVSENQQVTVSEPYELVNPFIGTGGHGHTYPGATVPFGMVQLSPDTRLEGWDGCSGYHYTDSVIYGFSHTHLSGTGVSDYGDILLTPHRYTQPISLVEAASYKGTTSLFSKEAEAAKPGYYEVYLTNAHTAVKLTATPHVGIHHYIFDETEGNKILLNLEHRDKVLESKITIEDNKTISGFRKSHAWATNQQVYFVIQFSEEFKYSPVEKGEDRYANLSFDNGIKEVMLKVGLSSTSVKGARNNMKVEADHWDFEEYLRIAKSSWESTLGKIEVKGKDKDAMVNFYSALYHTMIAPNRISDVDGKYRGMDGKIHQNPRDATYTIFSLWDTFRATHPLYTLIERKKTTAFINTFLNQYQQGGRLPVWELAANETDCMIGYHSVSVISDAYSKGIRGFDQQLALEAMTNSAEREHFGLKYYRNKGFIGAGDEPESVSKTLEYAYDDWCIAQFAAEVGATSVANEYSKRALYYQNLLDPETHFLRARMNGDWFKPFDPAEVNFNYTEANAWQYSLFAPQDINGLVDLLGGADKFDKRLDNLFTVSSETSGREQADITGLIGQYAHGNEPSHHMAYLYNFIEKPWKTQQRVRQILEEQYHNAPDGLSGNEDCGQMSAWYVLSAMGFYSVTPGLDYYVIGTPLFNEVNINMENGQKFRIKANNLSHENKYIQSALLNGKPYKRSFLKHAVIMQGGELTFEMGSKPNENWGTGEGNFPVAKVENDNFVAVPFIETEGMTFTDSLTIKLGSIQQHSTIYYSLNNEEFQQYKQPFTIHKHTDVQVYAQASNGAKSSTIAAQFKKIKKGRSIVLKSEYANQYAAGGDNTMIDYLRGNTNYRTGFWQGYQGQDIEAIVDLGKSQEFDELSAGFLQDIKSWIWYPKQVEFYKSDDGKKFELVAIVDNKFSNSDEGSFTQNLTYKGHQKARYVKLIARYPGDCPEWHLGAGGKSWVFIDEFSIE